MTFSLRSSRKTKILSFASPKWRPNQSKTWLLTSWIWSWYLWIPNPKSTAVPESKSQNLENLKDFLEFKNSRIYLQEGNFQWEFHSQYQFHRLNFCTIRLLQVKVRNFLHVNPYFQFCTSKWRKVTRQLKEKLYDETFSRFFSIHFFYLILFSRNFFFCQIIWVIFFALWFHEFFQNC